MSNPLEDVKGYTLGQLAAFVRKAGGPKVMDAVLKDEKRILVEDIVATSATPGRLIDISDQVELLIKAGYHEATGLSASAYRQLWPKTVVQPLEYL
ncbi:MAG: hypothetical protein AAB673_01565, partial [Patescibacteria group bacterium]